MGGDSRVTSRRPGDQLRVGRHPCSVNTELGPVVWLGLGAPFWIKASVGTSSLNRALPGAAPSFRGTGTVHTWCRYNSDLNTEFFYDIKELGMMTVPIF